MSIKIRFERTDCTGARLFYEDGSYKLIVGMSLQATESGGWGAREYHFTKWTEPKGELISDEKRSEIMRYIQEWAHSNNTLISISKGISKAEQQARIISKGWTVEELPNGGWKAIPPKK